MKVNSQTIVPFDEPSKIQSNTTWSDPVYYIWDDIVVEGNSVLTIEAGVQLVFFNDYGSGGIFNSDKGYSSKTGIFIEEDGAIFINGTQNSNVVMTADNTTTGWEGITISGDDYSDQYFNQVSHINYCIIEYVIKDIDEICTTPEAHGAIMLDNYNNIIIENSVFRYNQASLGGGIYITCNYSNNNLIQTNFPKILNNQFYNNNAKRGGAICLLKNHHNQSPLIESNTIYNNTTTNDGGGIAAFFKSDCIIRKNNIHDNIALCQEPQPITNSNPEYTGGGGIVIGNRTNAIIIDNIINENTANYNSSVIYDKPGRGGGILVRMNCSVTIYDNEINSNQAYIGAGIATYSIYNSFFAQQLSYIDAQNNEINYNTAEMNGGGIAIDHSTANIEFNNISNNSALDGYGGGFYINSNRPHSTVINEAINLYNNTIAYNYSDFAAGIYLQGDEDNTTEYSSDFNIVNNLMHSNNSYQDGAGIFFGPNWMEVNINNNTIVSNTSSTNQVGNAVFAPIRHDASLYSFVNNIMFYNGNDCQIFFPQFIQSEFNSNNIMQLGCQINPQNNYDYQPYFVNYPDKDFRLNPNSQLINLGYNNVSPILNIDIVNNSRFMGQIDIGAFEYDGSYVNYSISNTKSEIYPNPAKDYININSENQIVNLEIYNANGKLIYSRSSAPEYNIIDISEFSSGIYFIKIKTDFSSEFHKFIKY